MILLSRNISVLTEKSLTINKQLQDPVTYLKLEILYASKDIHYPFGPLKCEYKFCIIKFSTPCGIVLECLLNGKSRNINIGDIPLGNPLHILETEEIQIKSGKEKLSFNLQLNVCYI